MERLAFTHENRRPIDSILANQITNIHMYTTRVLLVYLINGTGTSCKASRSWVEGTIWLCGFQARPRRGSVGRSEASSEAGTTCLIDCVSMSRISRLWSGMRATR